MSRSRNRVTRYNQPATLRDTVKRPGKMVLILDGPYDSAMTAMLEAEKRGMRVNLAVIPNAVSTTDYLTTSELVRAHRAGHGLMVMGWSHANATTLSVADLVIEYNKGVQWVASTIGKPESEIDHCYSESAWNDTTNSVWYLRGRRAFGGGTGPSWWKYQHPFYKNHPFLQGRYSWSNSSHNTTLRKMKESAEAGEDIAIYTHRVDGGNLSNGITYSQLREGLDLALKLGIRLVNSDEFGDPPQSYLDDPGFEDADSFDTNFEVITSGLSAGQWEAGIVTTTPAEGMPGTKSLRIAIKDGAPETGTVTVRQRRWIPTTDWIVPPYSAEITNQGEGVLGARVKCNRTAGSGGAKLTLRTADFEGNIRIGTGNIYDSPTWTTNSWSGVREMMTTQYSATHGRNIGMTNFWQWFLPQYTITNMVGEAWFDHAMLTTQVTDNYA